MKTLRPLQSRAYDLAIVQGYAAPLQILGQLSAESPVDTLVSYTKLVRYLLCHCNSQTTISTFLRSSRPPARVRRNGRNGNAVHCAAPTGEHCCSYEGWTLEEDKRLGWLAIPD